MSLTSLSEKTVTRAMIAPFQDRSYAASQGSIVLVVVFAGGIMPVPVTLNVIMIAQREARGHDISSRQNDSSVNHPTSYCRASLIRYIGAVIICCVCASIPIEVANRRSCGA